MLPHVQCTSLLFFFLIFNSSIPWQIYLFLLVRFHLFYINILGFTWKITQLLMIILRFSIFFVLTCSIEMRGKLGKILKLTLAISIKT